MKRIAAIFTFLAFTFILNAQDAYKASNEGWGVKLDEAYELHKKTGKPIMANFTGSDWCGWCKKLTADVFSKQEFKNWAKENVILLELDFPKRKALPEDLRTQNNKLQASFQVTGYPTVWLFNIEKDKNGEYVIEKLGRTGYTPNPTQFINGVEQMMGRSKRG